MTHRLVQGAGIALAVLFLSLSATACSSAETPAEESSRSSEETAVDTTEADSPAAAAGCKGPFADFYANNAYAGVMTFEESTVADAAAALKYQTAEAPVCVMHGVGKDGNAGDQWELWYDGASDDAPQALFDELLAAGFTHDCTSLADSAGNCNFYLDAPEGVTQFDVYWGGSGPSFGVSDTIAVVAVLQPKF